MTTTTSSTSYPRQIKLRDGAEATLRLMTEADRDAVLAFARQLPPNDLLFLRMDITQPAVVEGWVANIKAGRTITILAEAHGRVVGYASLHRDEVLWTRHVGEIRLAVDPKFRRRLLGQRLANEIYTVARELGLRKLTAQMTPDQTAARATFERLGFYPEALLQDYVVDRQGRLRDLLVMSYDVAGFHDDTA